MAVLAELAEAFHHHYAHLGIDEIDNPLWWLIFLLSVSLSFALYFLLLDPLLSPRSSSSSATKRAVARTALLALHSICTDPPSLLDRLDVDAMAASLSKRKKSMSFLTAKTLKEILFSTRPCCSREHFEGYLAANCAPRTTVDEKEGEAVVAFGEESPVKWMRLKRKKSGKQDTALWVVVDYELDEGPADRHEERKRKKKAKGKTAQNPTDSSSNSSEQD
jgi:hypothetical protein